ncbi:SipW-cognate class signal peptide [Halorubrum xinjiangense]|uniref:SipW-cognate class signal peptide n=1 Tax=Halorubrum xinjiangense TaxID=261291 RepID=A0A1G7QXT3_9EURY|nr:VWA domain-containing protein [Halorubrum xinjiangense]SDG02689.1 SipW-cognate class signal peptide [Halorubrum xinjiangense]
MNPDTNDTIGLSRRKLLAGLGAVGVASAGAGLGTTAYFNDTETFEGNTLTAGELDLKLDYRATYAGGTGRIDEVNGWYPDFDVVEEEEGIYLIGEAPSIDEPDAWEDEVQTRDFCLPDVGLVNGDEIPVFVLEDVKSGDCGEVTISLHICDNPSWVWMNGELTENAQNGYSEPELEALEDLELSTDDPEGDGQLADAIDVTMWYDENCNNVLDVDAEEAGDSVCVQLVIDTSGSMGGSRIANTKSGAKQLAATILDANPDNQVGVTEFSSTADTPQPLTDTFSAVETAIDGLNASGGTNAQAGVDAGQAELENCPHDNRVMVVFGDGDINTDGSEAKDAGTEIFAIGVGGASFDDLSDLASDPADEHVFFANDDDAIEQLFGQVAETITAGEEIIFEGSLAGAMAVLSEGIALDGNRSVDGRQPYEGGLTQCIGFEWCLPAEVGNEVQTDSVAFDLGFYAEQFRHNDSPDVSFNGTDVDSNSTGNVSQ